MTEVKLTHIGGPTVLIEFEGWRILTDPTFDPAGGHYRFGWGTSSRKTSGPAIPAEEIGPLDAILVSHDHHEDNLDVAGRALLPSAGQVVTTAAGAKRLRGGTIGLAPWDSTRIESPGKVPIEVVATPCRHGPPLSRPIVGDVIGFALRWEGQEAGALWISGDTVLYPGVREVADRLQVGIALIHMGGVRFPVSGPLRYTMTAADAAELCELIGPEAVVPIHYEGWSHFKEERPKVEAELAARPAVKSRLHWIEPGQTLTLQA